MALSKIRHLNRCIVAVLGLAVAPGAISADFPTRPIRLMVAGWTLCPARWHRS